jgi:hypothetical protein
VSKKQKDVLMSLHHHLTTLAPSRGGNQVGKLLRVTPHTIDKLVGLFKGHTELIHQCSGLLQVRVIRVS